MATIDDISLEPWLEARSGWTGELISADGASTEDFRKSDVADVLQYAETPPGWDGATAGVIRLKDGRFVAWEADWGPTGNGFSRDAYGGTADLIFGHSQAAVLSHLSERARNLLIDYGM
jgi:hypothetical protein